MYKHHQKCDPGGEAENDAHFELARVHFEREYAARQVRSEQSHASD